MHIIHVCELHGPQRTRGNRRKQQQRCIVPVGASAATTAAEGGLPTTCTAMLCYQLRCRSADQTALPSVRGYTKREPRRRPPRATCRACPARRAVRPRNSGNLVARARCVPPHARCGDACAGCVLCTLSYSQCSKCMRSSSTPAQPPSQRRRERELAADGSRAARRSSSRCRIWSCRSQSQPEIC